MSMRTMITNNEKTNLNLNPNIEHRNQKSQKVKNKNTKFANKNGNKHLF